jgi:hypothetical protein
LGCIVGLIPVRPAHAQQGNRAPITKEVARAAGSVTLEITFPTPQFDTLKSGLLLQPFVGLSPENGECALPLALAKGSISVLQKEVGEMSLTLPVVVASNEYKPADKLAYPALPSDAPQTFGEARIEYIGKVSRADASRLRVGAIAYDRTSSNVKYLKKLTIRISATTLPSGKLTDVAGAVRVAQQTRRASNGKTNSIQGAKITQGIVSDDGKVHKFVIDRDGLYKVTYDDLKKYGLDPAILDLRTLRMVHNGVQVPIYIVDKHDDRFDPGDYIEFWAERKILKYESKFKDMYFDPYTRESIYYLVWGTRNSPMQLSEIKRIVEESGEVREGDPTKYVDLKDSSFTSKLHFEEDNWYEFLSNTDINELSTIRDHWYTAEIRRGGSYTITGQAPHPDIRKASPIRVSVGLHGFSTFDRGFVDYEGKEVPDVPNEQEASISVNLDSKRGGLVLWDTWDSQQLKFITTDSAQQLATGVAPTTQMMSGFSGDAGWPLSITVQHTKNTDVQSRFGLNWVDFEYDRMYNAWNNEILFRTPATTRDGFYQFTLGGFSRTDISIYRKGVSKISNVFISAITPGAKSIYCVFQAPVSGSSEEFIALSDSNKLKPKRYFVDDFLDLRNLQNAGEYLVISSRRLMEKDGYGIESSSLIPYLRRADRKGMKAKLIDVANIYDEFNGGSQSPEAIRNFLSYAYSSWAVPPKYVVLVGKVDDIPTPKIQSIRLGSISSDAWYAMVDGDDLLPDIAVGRVAARDREEVTAYIEKVDRYESDPAPSPMWKNQSLFISGNFALGSDFPSQVTTLLNSSVPRYTFAERGGLNIDQPYYTTHDEVIKRFNEGLNYVQFMGHGGHRAWDDYVDGEGRAILVQDDVPQMTNPSATFPFVTSLTCFTGSFEGDQPGLIPLLVNRKGGGAIGGYATSSFGFREADYHIAEALLPSVYDTLPATWGERVFRAKVEYYLQYGGFGKLVPQTLQYAYYYIGDPSVSQFVPTERTTLKLSTRTATPSSTITLEGETTVQSGTARVELVTEGNSPLPAQEHIIDNIPIANGRFSVTDVLPASIGSSAGTYKVTVANPSSKAYGRNSSDISFAAERITEVSVTPRHLVSNVPYSISAAVQVPQGVSAVVATITEYSTTPGGVEFVSNTQTVSMTLSGDLYVGNAAAPGASTRLVIAVEATANGGGKINAAPISVIVDGSSDPAIYSESHHNSFRAKLIATPNGLAYAQTVYNLGSVDAPETRVELLGKIAGSTSVLSSVMLPTVPAKSSVTVLLPYDGSRLDSVELGMQVVPDTGVVPYNFLDSTRENNSTLGKLSTLGAAAYLQNVGTTLTGQHSAVAFDNGVIQLDLGPNALKDVAATPIRVERVYEQLRNNQPDIQLIELDSSNKRRTHAIRVVTDSLGAVALDQSASPRTITIATADPRPELFIYRQDDRSKLWTILPTTRSGNQLTATIDHLGTFAIGYHTDKTPPVVEMTVEGQVFVDKGDVPEKPRLSVVIQDANGIDITTGKTVVKIDGQPVNAEIVSSLDTQRTQTTINLKLEPKLSNGRHTIAVTAVDNNGLQTEKQLEVNVSNDFVIQELGSYPNPFATVMFIAYEIKGIPFADEVEWNLYTVSGKLIKTHRFPSDNPEQTFGFVKGGTGTPTSLGYLEVWWDGRDNDGFDVANGVYYYRLKVKTERETKEITGKIARIR